MDMHHTILNGLRQFPTLHTTVQVGLIAMSRPDSYGQTDGDDPFLAFRSSDPAHTGLDVRQRSRVLTMRDWTTTPTACQDESPFVDGNYVAFTREGWCAS